MAEYRLDNPRPEQPKVTSDPLMYTGLLNAFMSDRNPIEVMVGDVQRMLNVLTSLGKNRRMARLRIEQLQQQVTRMESQIAGVNPTDAGSRFNKVR